MIKRIFIIGLFLFLCSCATTPATSNIDQNIPPVIATDISVDPTPTKEADGVVDEKNIKEKERIRLQKVKAALRDLPDWLIGFIAGGVWW